MRIDKMKYDKQNATQRHNALKHIHTSTFVIILFFFLCLQTLFFLCYRFYLLSRGAELTVLFRSKIGNLLWAPGCHARLGIAQAKSIH